MNDMEDVQSVLRIMTKILRIFMENFDKLNVPNDVTRIIVEYFNLSEW